MCVCVRVVNSPHFARFLMENQNFCFIEINCHINGASYST